MDARDRIIGDQPTDFLHKIAGIVPGYHGYVDRERRRDADKLLRTQLAHQYTEQRARLTRIQQTMVRSHHMENIAEVDRLAGVLQRFIDRLSTATYGYTGLFDPIKVEAPELDQLYAFDMALASGVDEVSRGVDTLESASSGQGNSEIPSALSRLATTVDELNRRLDERADLLTNGTRLPDESYQSMLSSLNEKTSTYPGSGAPQEQPSAAAGESARVNTASPDAQTGIPTTNLSMGGTTPDVPGMGSMTEGNQSFTDMNSGDQMGGIQSPAPMPITETGEVAGTTAGIETASSPIANPGAPGHDVIEGLDMAGGFGAGDIDAGSSSPHTPERGGAS